MYANLEPAAARRGVTQFLCLFALLAFTLTASAQPGGVSFGPSFTIPAPQPSGESYNTFINSTQNFPDVVRLMNGGNTIRVFLNDLNLGPTGTPGFSNFIDTPTSTQLVNITVGDFDGDGITDVIGVDFNGNQVLFFKGKGDGTFLLPRPYSSGGFDPIAACPADFNRDGKVDLAVANHFDQTLSILLGNGAGGFTQGAIVPFSGVPQSILCGRLFSGEVFQDVVITTPPGNSLLFFPGNGDGTFGPSQTVPAGKNPATTPPVLLGDMASIARYIVMMDDAPSSSPFLAGVTVNPSSLVSTGIPGPIGGFAVGDFNGLGQQEVVTVGPNGVGAGIFSQGSVSSFGSVVAQPGLMSPGAVSNVLVGDFNGDGRMDIFFDDGSGKNIKVLPGSAGTVGPINGHATVTNAPVKLQTGWYYDNALNGTGIFIEQGGKSGNGLFMGEFGYDASGNSLWYVSTGQMHGANYTSTWLKVTGGQTLTGPYKAPTNSSIGNVIVTFTDSAHITMTRPGAPPVNFTRFSFTSSATPLAPQAGAPQSGWWWAGSSLSGTGYGIEIQANAVFIVAYVYDTNGNPVWYLATGAMTSPTSYSGTWQLYSGGPQLTSPEGKYSGKVVTGSDVPMSLTFSDTTHGTLTMGNVVIPIVRFQEF